jgi:hypothetical protein
VVGEADQPEAAIGGLFADQQMAFIHARALVYGCFAFWIHRPGHFAEGDSCYIGPGAGARRGRWKLVHLRCRIGQAPFDRKGDGRGSVSGRKQ